MLIHQLSHNAFRGLLTKMTRGKRKSPENHIFRKKHFFNGFRLQSISVQRPGITTIVSFAFITQKLIRKHFKHLELISIVWIHIFGHMKTNNSFIENEFCSLIMPKNRSILIISQIKALLHRQCIVSPKAPQGLAKPSSLKMKSIKIQ